MSAKQLKQNQWQQFTAVAISVIAVAFFVVWYWHQGVYSSPENVFWGMIDQSLKTGSVTKTYSQAAGDQSMSQRTELYFKEKLLSHSLISIEDKNSTSKVVSETLGTPDKDYLKYREISSGKVGSPEAINVWAASDNPQMLGEELLSSPIIFGYLNSNQRHDLIGQMQSTKIFEIDFSATDTQANARNKSAYAYDVKLNVAGYFEVMKSYLKMIGQNNIAEQLTLADTVPTYSAIYFVNPNSRQLLQIQQSKDSPPQLFSEYDRTLLPSLPQTNMTIPELQQLLTAPAQS